jgi:hypothetical protein
MKVYNLLKTIVVPAGDITPQNCIIEEELGCLKLSNGNGSWYKISDIEKAIDDGWLSKTIINRPTIFST